MNRQTKLIILSTAVLGLTALVNLPARSSADPLVKMSGDKASPGVVTAWKGDGKKVELSLAADTDAKAVASAIEANVDRVKAKVVGGKVLVVGRTEAELLPALAEIDFGGDDLGMLAAATMDDGDTDSGSSLRAKKTADLEKLFKDAKSTATGKVVGISWGSFPETVVSVQVLRAPTGPMGQSVRKGKVVKFRPVFSKKGSAIDWSKESNQVNLGAWFLQKGDRVNIKLGAETKGIVEAEVISR